MRNDLVKVMVALPSMGYTHAESYCNRLANFIHLGRTEEQGRSIENLRLALSGEDTETANRIFKKFVEGTKFYYDIAGKRFEFYFAVIGRIFTPVARDQAAKMAIENDCDYLYMIDDDMMCPDDMFQRLYRHDVDLVAPLAFTRNYPHKPVMYRSVDEFDQITRQPFHTNVVIQNYPKNQLIECDAVGFGAALIKTWIIKKVESPWFMSTCSTGEDILFCYKAKKVGARIFMDTSTPIGHLGSPLCITEEYVDELRKKETPDFFKFHPLYGGNTKANSHKEAVFVTGDK